MGINKDAAAAAAAFGHPKKELIPPRLGIRNSDTLLISATSLASVESLSMPLVQEVVLSADIRCAECQRRVADIMSRMNGINPNVVLMQYLAETESVVVNLLEKKVILTTCKKNASAGKASSTQQVAASSTQQVAAIYRNPLSKVAIIRRIFRSSRS